MTLSPEAAQRIAEIAREAARASRLDEAERAEPQAELADHLAAAAQARAASEGAASVTPAHVAAAWAEVGPTADQAFFAPRRRDWVPRGARAWLAVGLTAVALALSLPGTVSQQCSQATGAAEVCTLAPNPLGIVAALGMLLALAGAWLSARLVCLLAAAATVPVLIFGTGGMLLGLLAPLLLAAAGLILPARRRPRGLPAARGAWLGRLAYLAVGVAAFPLAIRLEGALPWDGFQATFTLAAVLAVVLGAAIALALRERAPRALAVAGILLVAGLLAGLVGTFVAFAARDSGEYCTDHPYAFQWQDPALLAQVRDQPGAFSGQWTSFSDDFAEGALERRHGLGNASMQSVDRRVDLGSRDEDPARAVDLHWVPGDVTAEWPALLTDAQAEAAAASFAQQGFGLPAEAAQVWAQGLVEGKQAAGETIAADGRPITVYMATEPLAGAVRYDSLFGQPDAAPVAYQEVGYVAVFGDQGWSGVVAHAAFAGEKDGTRLKVDARGVAQLEWDGQVDGDIGHAARLRAAALGLDTASMMQGRVTATGPQCVHGD